MKAETAEQQQPDQYDECSPVCGYIDRTARYKRRDDRGKGWSSWSEAAAEYFVATSIGTGQCGPMMISMGKKSEEGHSATTVMSWMKKIDAGENNAPTHDDGKPSNRTLPALKIPPRLSPATPAKNTPEASREAE